VRRGFYDLAKAKAPIAMETLQRIAALYEIEARVRGKSAADRLAVRQAESKPLVTALRIWFEAQLAKLPARGPTADAIRYALNHWDGLERFLEDGRIELDNNSVDEVAPVWWTPDYLCSRSPRWPRQEEPTRLSSVVRWLSWCTLAARLRNWRMSSNRRHSRSGIGWRSGNAMRAAATAA
jgi:hypothetical protein